MGVLGMNIYLERKLIKIIKKQEMKIAKLERELSLDFGTGVFNKRQGFIKLKTQIERSHKENKPMSIAFVDVDRLKKINDEFGHTEGDRLLNYIATIIKKNIRKGDFVYRYGGDEFIIVFKDATKEEAKEIWDRVDKKIHEKNQKGLHPYEISLSAGFAEYDKNINIRDLIKHADLDMYRKKTTNYQK